MDAGGDQETQILITNWVKVQQHEIKEKGAIQEVANSNAHGLRDQNSHENRVTERDKAVEEIRGLVYKTSSPAYYILMHTILLLNLSFLDKTSKICMKKIH